MIRKQEAVSTNPKDPPDGDREADHGNSEPDLITPEDPKREGTLKGGKAPKENSAQLSSILGKGVKGLIMPDESTGEVES